MKLKKIVLILTILCMLLCVCSVSAAENDTVADDGSSDAVSNDANSDVSVDDSASEGSENVASESPQTTSSAPATTSTQKIDAYGLCSNAFLKKTNKYYTVKVCTYNQKKNKLEFQKGVKLIVKVKINGKTKTYNVKTNKKGEAKIFNVKNLKVGTYKVTVQSDDAKFNVKESGYLGIFAKKVKSVTVKMNKKKKLKGDTFEALYFAKNGEYEKGVYANNYNTKGQTTKAPHCLIIKAKFFFKNKKTGKVIQKTIKSKTSSLYGWEYPYSKLISGYTPVKAKIYYVTQ